MNASRRCCPVHTVLGLPRRGFTLVEMVLGLAIMSILMTGLASAIMIAGHALPNDESRAMTIVKSAEVADQLVEELRSAIWIRQHTTTIVEFTVPDRDSDGVPERIRYKWSAPGTALIRQYNGGAEIDILEDVNEFVLVYDLKTVTEEYPGPAVECAETTLSDYTTTVDPMDFNIEVSKWPGQYFQPTLPGNALGWKVTRVQVEAKASGDPVESTWVQLRVPDADNKPTDTLLEEVEMLESALGGSYQWEEFSFSSVTGLSPNEGLCLVLKHSGAGAASADIRYDNDGGSGGLRTNDGGSNWGYFSGRSLSYYVYGTYMVPGSPLTVSRQYVTGVRIALRAGDDPASRVVTAAQTLNTPELLSGMWEADFDLDPTLDHNGDGNDDWVVREGGPFNLGSLSGGVWDADVTLDTYPNNDFTTLTTVKVCFRNTSIGGDGAVFRINADWDGSTFAKIIASLQLQPDNTQRLTVYHKLDSSTKMRLVTVLGLSTDFVTLRLLIDPGSDVVNVKVNGQDYGTFVYNTFTPPHNNRLATILADGSSAEFDYVSIRVSE